VLLRHHLTGTVLRDNRLAGTTPVVADQSRTSD
jgi:hypothetical protein